MSRCMKRRSDILVSVNAIIRNASAENAAYPMGENSFLLRVSPIRTSPPALYLVASHTAALGLGSGRGPDSGILPSPFLRAIKRATTWPIWATCCSFSKFSQHNEVADDIRRLRQRRYRQSPGSRSEYKHITLCRNVTGKDCTHYTYPGVSFDPASRDEYQA